MTQKRVRGVVTGRVQGVGFRYFVQRAATGLGLKGWVRNLDCGDVEFVVQGEAEAVDGFIAQVRSGPQLAWIKSLMLEAQRLDTTLHSFEIKPTSW